MAMVECHDLMSCWENLHSEMAYWMVGASEPEGYKVR